MPNRVRVLTVPDKDRAELERRARSKEILAATVTPAAGILRTAGVTHWSSRRLADWLDQAKGISVSHDSISVLCPAGVNPNRTIPTWGRMQRLALIRVNREHSVRRRFTPPR